MCVVSADGTTVLVEELSAWPPSILAKPCQALPLGFSRGLANLRIEARGRPPIYQLAVAMAAGQLIRSVREDHTIVRPRCRTCSIVVNIASGACRALRSSVDVLLNHRRLQEFHHLLKPPPIWLIGGKCDVSELSDRRLRVLSQCAEGEQLGRRRGVEGVVQRPALERQPGCVVHSPLSICGLQQVVLPPIHTLFLLLLLEGCLELLSPLLELDAGGSIIVIGVLTKSSSISSSSSASMSSTRESTM